ncbi:putative general amidase [Phaeomoniella chlamydospora]|uniref:Putative general amidase n=1 Tax=Phaeomoniella chlamydospora TaxID=158046 RepID=A0A0G2GLJ4_PHACM|nr:putative general amidase [Phaeomoniella chlamydospora]
MKEYLNSEPWKVDPGLLPIPWRDGLAELQEPTRKLKVAFVIDDGVVLPQPPITRAISYIRDLFDRFGHQTSTWSHASTHRSAYYDLWLPSVLADGGKRCADLCAQGGGQPLIEGMLVGQPSDEMNVAQRQAHAEKIYDYQLQYLKQWEDSDIDAIIMPVMPWISYKPKQWVQSNQYVGYSSVWNLVDYAALAAPSGCVVEREKDDPTKVKHWAEHEKRNPSDEYNWNQFDLDLVEGMPVPVQIIGGRFGEETCVMVAKVLEEMRRKDMEKRGS